MNIKVVTTYNNKLYNEYAHRFFSTYNWPFDVVKYNEDDNLFDLVPECKKFVERNKKRPVRSYHFDGVRFCYKVYAYTHAMLNENVDGLICIDADSVFHKPIDMEFIKEYLHKPDAMMAYLGRRYVHSECGFLYFNLQHPETKNYARMMKQMYDEDLIYNLKECHDSYVWDYARIKFEKEKGVKNINISNTAKGYDLHIQALSILGKYYDHCKGKRKAKGRSPENKQL